MKSLIVYDSWYGNTQAIAEAIASTLDEDVELMRVGADSIFPPEAYDLVVIGSPTHGGVPTPAIQDFLKTVSAADLAGTALAAFDTRLTPRWTRLVGFASKRIAKQLSQTGGRIIAPPEGFYVRGKAGPLAAGEIDRAKAWAVYLAQQVTAKTAA